MDLRWSWLAVLLTAVAGLALWLSLRRRRETPSGGLLVAHVARLRSLPRYQQLARRQLAWTVVRVVAAAVVLVGSVLLAARPTDAVTEDPEAIPGDLVLCLDITPPVQDAAVRVLAQARRMVGRLEGERVGLYAFQDATVELMPLTDDHGYARNRLHTAQTVIAGLDEGTSAAASAGDGLVSCAEHFDRPATERGRAVVLLSVNGPAASPIHTLVQGAEYAADQDVVVYGIAPAIGGAARTDFATAVELTGGRLLSLDGKAPLEQVRRLERDRLDPPATPVRRDTPRGLTVVVLLGLGALVLRGAGVAPVNGAWKPWATMLLLGVLILIRPGIGETRETTAAPGSDLEVLLVVDETLSMSALDHAGVRSRLEGVREDLSEVTGALPNSRFALLTFGSTAQLELPFTSDPEAVEAAVDGIAREPMLDGSGSRMDRPLKVMRQVLGRAHEEHPERRRVVVFASDGENTAEGKQQPFDVLDEHIDAGAVFGYGTAKGGLMPTGGEPPWTFVRDFSTGRDAVSRLDEKNLQRIADQMGVDYARRGAPGGLDDWARGLAGGSEDPDGDGQAKYELYWLLAILLAGLAVAELRLGLLALRDARRAVTG